MGLDASLGRARQSTDIEELLLFQERGCEAVGYDIANFLTGVHFVGRGGQRLPSSHLLDLHVGRGLLLLNWNCSHPIEHSWRFVSSFSCRSLVAASATSGIPAIATVR